MLIDNTSPNKRMSVTRRYRFEEPTLPGADKYISDFYNSKDYHSRLAAIKSLIDCEEAGFSMDIIVDGLKDYCSIVRQYVLQHYEFPSQSDIQLETVLEDIAINDEKALLRVLAIEKLAAINPSKYFDLFFSTSLLKSSRESAAGLRGLLLLDEEKAYAMAKFRTSTSRGELDIAITEVLTKKARPEDLAICKHFLKSRKKFFKTRYTPVYLNLLEQIGKLSLMKQHIEFISEDIKSTNNRMVISFFVQQLHDLVRSINRPENNLYKSRHELDSFVEGLIDGLLGSPPLKMVFSA